MAEDWEPLVRYWRASLADSALGKGRFKKKHLAKLIRLSESERAQGRVANATLARLFDSKPASMQAITVRLWPMLVARRHSHGADRDDGLPQYVAPIVTEAELSRDGWLRPKRTVIARDLLEPLPEGAFSIGAVDDLDTFLTTSPFSGVGQDAGKASLWQAYRQHCQRLLREVAGGWPQGDAEYEPTDHGLIEEAEEVSNTIKNILSLYDHILAKKPPSALLKTYASGRIRDPVPCLPAETEFAKRLGHCSDRFALADHQRDVLAHLAVAGTGEILAVNGPPGTGKTTMLLSAIAGEWAEAALDGGDPPVIIAASTNNQAVTNIIDAFGKDFAKGEGPFAGRWLPGIDSFGLFLPSQSREAKASRDYQTESFFQKLETPAYVQDAERAYLTAARRALPDLRDPDLRRIVSALQNLIRTEVGKLAAADAAQVALSLARNAMAALGPDPEAAHAERQRRRDRAARDHAAASQLVGQWEQYLVGEPILLSLFSFLPPVAARRALRARLFLRAQGAAGPVTELSRVEEMDTALRRRTKESGEELRRLELEAERSAQLLIDFKRTREAWGEAVRQLDCSDEQADDVIECDRRADSTVRFRLFLLATHYWEGRWLLDMREALPTIEADRKKTGRTTVVPRWRRRMMLTPCAVATFATLPDKMVVTGYAKGKYIDDYLYDFINLLIVDEAGQALPETAGASFALAKKALVIGDTRQMEPISSIPRVVDIGNLTENGILPAGHDEADHSRIVALGVTSSDGSVMRIAQAVGRYHPHADLERGLYLFEHRRCYDEIIAFCNDLCYKGSLQPKRGPADPDGPLRPLSYLHVDGLCAPAGGSRNNLLEAQTITAWLAANRERLEQHYHLPLESLAGVITPFGSQVRAIKNACRKNGIRVDKEGDDDPVLTVGTVHSLQGAERPLVIFSSVYSKHADGSFIDDSPSMLNVAVSRAKDSFLVFGDMDVFSSARSGSPRALLASFLFRDPANALEFDVQPRADLVGRESRINMLRDVEEHDAFLHTVLDGEAGQIHITSPWILVPTMEYAGILQGLRQASQRGVRIRIYVDYEWNDVRGRDHAEKATQFEKAHRVLSEIGVGLIPVHRLHSKIVTVDDRLLCIGSFNWLSADRNGRYVRHETSLVYEGRHLEKEIAVIRDSLARRRIKEQTKL